MQDCKEGSFVVDNKDRATYANFCSLCGAWRGQLGLEPTPDLYVEHLSLVFKEVYRVLRKTGLFFLNIADTYCGGHKGGSTYGNLTSKEREEQIKGFQIHEGRPQAIVKGWEEKCLLCMPERIMFSCINMGFILRNKIPWIKENCMPSSVTDRFACSWEYIYMFAKTNDTQYWTNNETGQLVSKQPKGIHGEEGKDWEWRECPKCDGTGKIIEETCPRCKGTGKIKHSFWRGHDYFFDIDALRMPHSEEALARYGRGFGSPTNKYIGQDPAMIGGAKIDLRPKEFKDYQGKFEGFKERAELFGSPRARTERKGRRSNNPELNNRNFLPIGTGFDNPSRKKTSDESFKAGGMRQAPELGEEGAFNVKGRGPRDFFFLPTQPFSKAHFAVYPPSLIFQPILVGCPKEVCKKCGKPKIRISERIGELKYTEEGSPEGINRSKMKWGDSHPTKNPRWNYSGKTVGYAQCDCGDDFEPGIILDPFCGAGTTPLVAKILGRDYIGIDISKEFCKMAEERIKDPNEIEKSINSIKKAFPEIWEREIVKQLKLFNDK